MSLIHNERIKLTATALNAAAGSSFTVGVLAPMAAAFYSLGSTTGVGLETVILGAVIWILTAVALHLAARHVLGGLKDDE